MSQGTITGLLKKNKCSVLMQCGKNVCTCVHGNTNTELLQMFSESWWQDIGILREGVYLFTWCFPCWISSLSSFVYIGNSLHLAFHGRKQCMDNMVTPLLMHKAACLVLVKTLPPKSICPCPGRMLYFFNQINTEITSVHCIDTRGNN